VLLTVNIVSHNPARSSSDNIPLNLQTITITQILSIGWEGRLTFMEQGSHTLRSINDPVYPHTIAEGLEITTDRDAVTLTKF